MNSEQKNTKIKCKQIQSRLQKFAKFSCIEITVLPLYVTMGGTDKGALSAVCGARPNRLRHVHVLHSAMWWKWAASANHKVQFQQCEHPSSFAKAAMKSFKSPTLFKEIKLLKHPRRQHSWFKNRQESLQCEKCSGLPATSRNNNAANVHINYFVYESSGWIEGCHLAIKIKEQLETAPQQYALSYLSPTASVDMYMS